MSVYILNISRIYYLLFGSKPHKQLAVFLSIVSLTPSSSLSHPPPIFWGRWSIFFSILPCSQRRPTSSQQSSCLCYMHLFIVGLVPIFFFSLVCPHPAFFSLHASLSFSSHGRTTSVVSPLFFTLLILDIFTVAASHDISVVLLQNLGKLIYHTLRKGTL